MNSQALQAGQIQALVGIAESMTTTFSRQDILDAILGHVVQDLGYKAGSVRLLDAERKTLTLQAAKGLSQAYLSKGVVEVDKSAIDRDVLAGKTTEIYDAVRDPGLQYPEAVQREQISSVLALPLTIQGRTMGVLRLYTAEPHHFSEEERAFLGAIANLMTRAISTAHLFQAFQSIARAVNSSLKLEDVLVGLLNSTLAEMNYKGGLIRLIDVQRQVMRLVAAVGLSRDYLAKGDVRIGDSAVDREVLQGKPVTIYDVTTDPRFQYRDAAAREGIRSLQAVPLSVDSTIIGVLRVYSSQPQRFSDEECAFLSAVADLGAIAIQNARYHQALNEKYETLKTDSAGWHRFLTLS